MTHDPLCPQADVYSLDRECGQKHWSCHCDLIAQVRADMVQRAVGMSYYINPTDPAEQGYNAGREIAIEVLSNAVAG